MEEPDPEVEALRQLLAASGSAVPNESQVRAALQRAAPDSNPQAQPDNWMLKYNSATKQYESVRLGTAQAKESSDRERASLEHAAERARAKDAQRAAAADYARVIENGGSVRMVKKSGAEALRDRLVGPAGAVAPDGSAVGGETEDREGNAAAPVGVDIVDLHDADEVESKFRVAGIQHRAPEPEDEAAWRQHWALGQIFRRALASGPEPVCEEIAAELERARGRLDPMVMSAVGAMLPAMLELKKERDAARAPATGAVHAGPTPDGHGARRNIRSQEDYEERPEDSPVPADWIPKSLIDVAEMCRQVGTPPTMAVMKRLGTPPLELEAMELFADVMIEALREQERQYQEMLARAAAVQQAKDLMAGLGISANALNAAVATPSLPTPPPPAASGPAMRSSPSPSHSNAKSHSRSPSSSSAAGAGAAGAAASPPARPFQAFHGQGHSLGRGGGGGSAAPATSPASAGSGGPLTVEVVAGADPQSVVEVDESQPVARVQLQLPGGKKLAVRLNSTHRVSDVRRVVDAALRLPPGTDYVLKLRQPPPGAVLSRPEQTVAAAGLAGASVTVELVTK